MHNYEGFLSSSQYVACAGLETAPLLFERKRSMNILFFSAHLGAGKARVAQKLVAEYGLPTSQPVTSCCC